jgi:hypothetical protein
MIVVLFLKIWKVVVGYFLYNILLSWHIYRQKILFELFASYKPEKCRICFIFGVKVFFEQE